MGNLNVLLVARTDSLAGPVTARLFDAGFRVRLVRSPRPDDLLEAEVVVVEGDDEIAPRVMHAVTQGDAPRPVILLLWRGAGLPDGVWATLPAASAAEQLVPLLAQLAHEDEVAA